MNPSPAVANHQPPVIAFLGASQVGKSSLVNGLAGARLLPTTGEGSPRSQAVCEWHVPAAPLSDGLWHVNAEWLPNHQLRALANPPHDSLGVARWRLLCKDLSVGRIESLTQRLEILGTASDRLDWIAFAVDREVAWLPIDTPVTSLTARMQVTALTADWPAALAQVVQVSQSGPPSLLLVDLPGLGHADLGGEASASWLAANAPRVAAIVCVVGPSLPEVLVQTLQRYWGLDELRERLYMVATFGDRLVDDATNADHRAGAAVIRRRKVAEQLASILGFSGDESSLYSRTFCVDPRPNTRHWQPVDFDGELERLRRTLLAAQALDTGAAEGAAPAASSSSRTHEESVEPCFKEGEPLGLWLERAVLPLLREGAWAVEPLRSGRTRMHLQGTDCLGARRALVTIYGTGMAYCVAGLRTGRVSAPDSEHEAGLLRRRLVAAASLVGISAQV